GGGLHAHALPAHDAREVRGGRGRRLRPRPGPGERWRTQRAPGPGPARALLLHPADRADGGDGPRLDLVHRPDRPGGPGLAPAVREEVSVPGIGINDLRAITPALILFLSGITVLVVDLFRRGPAAPSGTPVPRPTMHPVVHLLAAGGAFLAGVAVLASLGQPSGLFFGGGIRVELFSRVLAGIIVLGTL